MTHNLALGIVILLPLAALVVAALVDTSTARRNTPSGDRHDPHHR